MNVFVYGTITAAIVTAIMAANPVMGYTLDADLGKTQSIFKAMELKNVKITDLPKTLKATNPTLISSYDQTRLYIDPTHVSFVGSIQYETPDGSKNIASTYIASDISKIKGNVYTLKGTFNGPDGTMTINGDTGTIHLEGIDDPKPTD
jgi:hypothetical protein